MLTIFASIVVFLLLALGLSAGWLLGRPALKGSCGTFCTHGCRKRCQSRHKMSDSFQQHHCRSTTGDDADTVQPAILRGPVVLPQNHGTRK